MMLRGGLLLYSRYLLLRRRRFQWWIINLDVCWLSSNTSYRSPSTFSAEEKTAQSRYGTSPTTSRRTKH